MPVTPITPAQTDALAKLAEIPAEGSEERDAWLKTARQYIATEYRGFQCIAWRGLLTLMSEARKQGQRDCLGATPMGSGSQASPEAPTDPRPEGFDPSRGPLASMADEYVQRVAEWDDRTSPEDWPEAMLITPDELKRELIQFAVDTIEADRDNERSSGLAAANALEGWRTIETAPKDGTPILLATEDRRTVAIGHWFATGTSWVDRYGRLNGDAHHLKETGIWSSEGGWFQPNEVSLWAQIPALGTEAEGQDAASGLVHEGPATSVATPQPLPQSTPSQPEMTVEEAKYLLSKYDLPDKWIEFCRRSVVNYQCQADRLETALRILSSHPAAVLREPGKGGRS